MAKPRLAKFTAVGLAVALAAGGPTGPLAAARAKKPPALWPTDIKPAGAVWFLRQDSNRCTLRSSVIGGERFAFVEVTAGLYDDLVTSVTLVSGVKLDLIPWAVAVKFGDAPARLFPAFAVPENDKARLHVSFSIGQEPMVDLAQGTPILIGTGREMVGVRTKSIAPKLRALRACMEARMVTLGFDRSMIVSVATPPILGKNTLKAFPAGDYPLEARKKNEQGAVEAALLISASGKVEQCVIAASSNSKALDLATCGRLNKVDFEPGRDRDGKAIPSAQIVNVHWLLTEWGNRRFVSDPFLRQAAPPPF